MTSPPSRFMSHRAQLLCAWTGPAFVVTFLIGFVPLAAFLIWIVLMTVELIKTIAADRPDREPAPSPATTPA